MEAVTSSAVAYNNAISLQNALYIYSTLGMMAHLNPYGACVQNNTAYDYIVVGGGTSGCVVANQLSDDENVRVLLIEAGPNFDLETGPSFLFVTKQSYVDFNYTAQPDPNYKRCHRDGVYHPTVAKVLGGVSSVDFMLYSQGTEEDYNLWADISNKSAWAYPNILRQFKKIEKFHDEELENSPDRVFHGFEGYVGITKDHSPANEKYYKAFSQLGKKVVRDINNNTKTGVTGSSVYLHDGIRQNSAYAFLTPVRKRKNLFVLKKAQATRILFNKDKRAVAVIVVQLNTTYIFRANREIIVAAGTFNTVKLLQLSGIGPKEVLDPLGISVVSDLPVGYNYANHQAAVILAAIQKTKCKSVPENNDPSHYASPSFVSYNSLNKSNPNPEYRTSSFIIPTTPPTLMLTSASFLYRFKNEIVDTWYREITGWELMFTLVENNYPESSGVVKIRSRDPFDSLFIDTLYYFKESDIEDMVRYVKDFIRIFETPYFKELGAHYIDPTKGACGDPKTDGDDFWRCYVRCLTTPLPHHVGTTAMGKVVDGRLCVNGVTGLRVVGASIMPRILGDAITVPVMVIGMNAAEMIKKDNSRK